MIDRLFHFVRQIQLFSLFLLAPGGEDLLAKRLVVILAIRISSRRRHAFPLMRDFRRHIHRRHLSPSKECLVEEEPPDQEKNKMERLERHTITSLKKTEEALSATSSLYGLSEERSPISVSLKPRSLLCDPAFRKRMSLRQKW